MSTSKELSVIFQPHKSSSNSWDFNHHSQHSQPQRERWIKRVYYLGLHSLPVRYNKIPFLFCIFYTENISYLLPHLKNILCTFMPPLTMFIGNSRSMILHLWKK